MSTPLRSRTVLLAALLGLVVICATVLGALQVANADRVLDLMGNVVASFLGALTGAGLLASRVEPVEMKLLQGNPIDSLAPAAKSEETSKVDGA